ncbi:hypothetical protein BJV78DRAFT_1156269 [Lactifluus subvellereus]|nr:hypothetical protein BJV78DRAFT_1156269 [Lactifluus subvellereus]
MWQVSYSQDCRDSNTYICGGIGGGTGGLQICRNHVCVKQIVTWCCWPSFGALRYSTAVGYPWMRQQCGAIRHSTSPDEETEQQQLELQQQSQQPPQQPQQQPQQPQVVPIVSLLPGSQPVGGAGSVRGLIPIGSGQAPLNRFGGPQMHRMGMRPMTPIHATGSSMMHGPPPGVLLNQHIAQSKVLQSSIVLISYVSNKVSCKTESSYMRKTNTGRRWRTCTETSPICWCPLSDPGIPNHRPACVALGLIVYPGSSVAQDDDGWFHATFRPTKYGQTAGSCPLCSDACVASHWGTT